LSGARGVEMTRDDQMRARVIEMIMCDFALDLTKLRREFGDLVDTILPDIDAVMDRFCSVVDRTETGFDITRHARHVARLVANLFDTYRIESALYSKAS
ncbi:MAG: coproporphyrinogen III oxidase, partial [Yoonia sp.]|nr:coproporphyrinogen III oxidase [Yoonia sp.]